MRTSKSSLILALLSTLAVACNSGTPSSNKRGVGTNTGAKTDGSVANNKDMSAMNLTSIFELAKSNDSLKTLTSILQSTGLDKTLMESGTFTVFAPTDAAFEKLKQAVGEDAFDAIVADKDQLSQILKYHVLDSKQNAAALLEKKSIKTITGVEVSIAKSGNDVLVNGASKVAAADIMASNGIVHVIDSVLTPPKASEKVAETPVVKNDIVTLAKKAGSFKTLLAALEVAGLASALDNGQFTVFAPNDDAFNKIGLHPDNVAGVDKEKLKAILLNHVIPGEKKAAEVVQKTNLVTVNGGVLAITKNSAGNVFVDSSRIIATDIDADNGVVHVVDSVILPK